MLGWKSAVAVAAALIVAPAATQRPVEVRQGEVSGMVVERASSRPLPGAEVELLKGGVHVAGAVKSGPGGGFALAVAPGTYDLRIRHSGRRAEVLRDLEVVEGGRQVLPAVGMEDCDALLQRRGVAVPDRFDGDGDGVPDAWERSLGLDPSSPDSDLDGISDFTTAAVSAEQWGGAAAANRVPTVLWPPPDTVLPVAPGCVPPLLLRFATVPGATGFRAEFECAEQREAGFVVHAEFQRGELVVGEQSVALMRLPDQVAEGNWRVRLQGYFADPARRVGEEVNFPLRFEQTVAEARRIEQSARAAGVLFGTSLCIASGTELRVPAGEVLVLAAGAGGVVVEPGASVIGEGGSRGGSVMVLSAGDVQVEGVLRGGVGQPGEHVTNMALPGEKAICTGGGGGRGGDLAVAALGALTVARRGLLAAGEGGAGGTAVAAGGDAWTAVGRRGGSARAIGGEGGAGGDLVLVAADLKVADRAGILRCGNGGAGGSVQACAGAGAGDLAGGGALAESGIGGPSGDVWLSHYDLRRDGLVLLDEAWPLQGGCAGAAGQVVSMESGRRQEDPEEEDDECGCPGSSERGEDAGIGRDGRKHKGHNGHTGWWRGGAGAKVVSRAGDGVGCGRGGDAHAEGGDGGSIKSVGVSLGFTWIRLGVHFARAGKGGDGRAFGGDGGPLGAGPGPGDPGRGGDACGIGGSGGDGLKGLLDALSTGGNGGWGQGVGGEGSDGYDCCRQQKPGGSGGDGGDAEAYGGDGGDANSRGGNGGTSWAIAGGSGNGGWGCPEGEPGLRGSWISVAGSGGNGTNPYSDGRPGNEYNREGWAGVPGLNCCDRNDDG